MISTVVKNATLTAAKVAEKKILTKTLFASVISISVLLKKIEQVTIAISVVSPKRRGYGVATKNYRNNMLSS